MKCIRTRPLVWPVLALSVAMVGIPGWLTYVAVRRENLNILLVKAVNDENTARVRQLLDQGADANTWDDLSRHAPTFRELLATFLRRTAKPRDRESLPLLQDAVVYDNIEIAKMLADKGADVNAQDLNGFTALDEAIYSAEPAMVKLLLNHGADVNAIDKDSAVSWAAKMHQTEIVHLLLDRGAVVTDGD